MTRLFPAFGAAFALGITACDHAAPADATEGNATPIQTGVASFYGREFAGRQTASGEPLKMNAMTAASRTLPIGTRVQVVNTETGQSAKVRINDRGPYANGRVLDLTPMAAQQIGLAKDDGLAHVAIRATSANGPPAARR